MMRITKLALLALVAERVHGYLDTSPFFLFSTSELLIPHAQLQQASSLTSDVSDILSQCPSDIYVLVTQPGVSASDYAAPENMPALAQYMTTGERTPIRSSARIADVAGEIDTRRWQQVLEKDCGATTFNIHADSRGFPKAIGRTRTLLKVSLSTPTFEPLSQTLNENDAFFASVMAQLPSQNYTVLYTTTPSTKRHERPSPEASKYEMETPLEDVMHLDLKRDVDFRPRQSSSNQTLVDGPLFEKYQFLSPGLFMGLLVGILLLSILYVAVSGVASMQVTYAAFDKESGALAQKKSQ